jgi:Helix-turn-helix domain/Domain of unknown function (DUF4115)
VTSPDHVRASLDNLRRERERRGLSFDDVARLAKIPARYVKALEEDDVTVLPKGPFRNGYRKQYLEFLGLDEQDLVATERAAAPEVPVARLVAGGFAVTVLLVVALRVGAAALDWIERPAEIEVAGASTGEPSQVVGVRAVDATRITVRVDGGAVEPLTLAAGENREVRGTERVEIDAQDLTRVVVTYNGERVEPLGNISRGRRLVFLAGD